MESDRRRTKIYSISSACFRLYKYYAYARSFTYSKIVCFNSGKRHEKKEDISDIIGLFSVLQVLRISSVFFFFFLLLLLLLFCFLFFFYLRTRETSSGKRPRMRKTYPILTACFWVHALRVSSFFYRLAKRLF